MPSPLTLLLLRNCAREGEIEGLRGLWQDNYVPLQNECVIPEVRLKFS